MPIRGYSIKLYRSVNYVITNTAEFCYLVSTLIVKSYYLQPNDPKLQIKEFYGIITNSKIRQNFALKLPREFGKVNNLQPNGRKEFYSISP